VYLTLVDGVLLCAVSRSSVVLSVKIIFHDVGEVTCIGVVAPVGVFIVVVVVDVLVVVGGDVF